MHPHGLGSVLSIIIPLLTIPVVTALVILIFVAKWKAYEKAGRKGWESLVPFYNFAVLLEMTNEPLWWTALLFVPVANLFVSIVVLNRVSRAFGHGGWFTAGLIFLPFIFWPILAFGSSQYRNEFPPASPASSAAKWSLAAAAFYGVSYSVMLLGVVLSGTSSAHRPLSIIKSSANDGHTYATDGVYVYADDRIVEGADPAAFRSLGTYSADDLHVYYESDPVEGADAYTFRTLQGDYAIDSRAAYYMGKQITGADHGSFKVLDYDYAVDAGKAYFDGDGIAGADASSFSILGSEYAKDRTQVYYSGAAIDGADPATFTVVPDPSGEGAFDARDKNHEYQYGKMMPKGR